MKNRKNQGPKNTDPKFHQLMQKREAVTADLMARFALKLLTHSMIHFTLDDPLNVNYDRKSNIIHLVYREVTIQRFIQRGNVLIACMPTEQGGTIEEHMANIPKPERTDR